MTFTPIHMTLQCDQGHAKLSEAPSKTTGCVRATSLMGGPFIRPIGSKTLYQLRRASRTPERQALLPGHSLYGTRSSHSVHAKYPRKRDQEASNICPCITKSPYLEPPPKLVVTWQIVCMQIPLATSKVVCSGTMYLLRTWCRPKFH